METTETSSRSFLASLPATVQLAHIEESFDPSIAYLLGERRGLLALEAIFWQLPGPWSGVAQDVGSSQSFKIQPYRKTVNVDEQKI